MSITCRELSLKGFLNDARHKSDATSRWAEWARTIRGKKWQGENCHTVSNCQNISTQICLRLRWDVDDFGRYTGLSRLEQNKRRALCPRTFGTLSYPFLTGVRKGGENLAREGVRGTRGRNACCQFWSGFYSKKKKNSYLQTARRQFMGVQFSYFSIPNTGWLRSIKKRSGTALALFPKQSGRYLVCYTAVFSVVTKCSSPQT